MLKALLAHGMRAELVVGSSVGAINAAYFAGDPTLDGVARLEAIWRGMRRSDVFPTRAFSSLLRLLSRRGHLVDSAALARLLERHLPYQRLEDRRGCRVTSSPPTCSKASSCACPAGRPCRRCWPARQYPGVFPPVRSASAGWSMAGWPTTRRSRRQSNSARRGWWCCRPVIRARCRRYRGMRSAAALHALNMLIARQLTDAIRRYRPQVEIVVVPPLCPLGVSPFDFSAVGSLLDRAQRSTEQWLRDGVEQTRRRAAPVAAAQPPGRRARPRSGRPAGGLTSLPIGHAACAARRRGISARARARTPPGARCRRASAVPAPSPLAGPAPRTAAGRARTRRRCGSIRRWPPESASRAR